MKKDQKNISIGDEITYRDRYASEGFSKGKIVGKLDHTILVVEIIDNGMVRNKLVDESEIESIVTK